MKFAFFLLGLLLVPSHALAQLRPPIIDMHLHANTAESNGPPPLGICIPILASMPPLDPKESWEAVFVRTLKNPTCSDPIWSPTTDGALIEQTIAELEQRNIVGVLSGTPDLVRRWSKMAPERFIGSVQFQLGPDAISPADLRDLFDSGEFAILGEVTNQYVGIAANDARMEPYWALAEELDIPVAIHLGEGPPGAARLSPKYRAELSSPYLLEDVLQQHPYLRLSVMHYGSPLVDEMIAMLGAYPQLYIDIGGIQWMYSRSYFYMQLNQFIDAGVGKRIMFGSDQMNWPGIIGPSIAVIEEADFLTEEQKRDILYNNAARFLRLSDETIARHHGMNGDRN